MSFRAVRGLETARACERPVGIPFSRPRGAKAAGLRYERDLAKAMPSAKHGQWWEYRDLAGPGFCQTDLIYQLASGVLVLEAKYTWTETGHQQLERLYLPVVSRALAVPTCGIVVCKVLTTEVPRNSVCSSLEEALGHARAGRRAVLHWLGTGLGPLQHSQAPAHVAERLAIA